MAFRDHRYGDAGNNRAIGDRSQFSLPLDSGATLEDLLEMLTVDEKCEHTPLVNGRRATLETVFEKGDTLVLLPPIAGG